MPNPQQSEVRRSETVPALTPDATESDLEARRDRIEVEDGNGPIPADQQPGHHPDVEQDQAKAEVADALGIRTDDA